MSRSRQDILDQYLVLAAQDGSDDGLERLMARWLPRWRAHAWRLLRNQDQVADAVQESCLHIVRRLPKLNDPATFATWSFRIVHRRCVDSIRGTSRDRVHDQTLRDAATDAACDIDEASTSDDNDALNAAIALLEPDDRALLHLFYVEQLRVKDIAHVLGRPAGTMKYRLHVLREQLRASLQDTTESTQGVE